ncbi:MAG: STAS domain-containing protein [bacterium]
MEINIGSKGDFAVIELAGEVDVSNAVKIKDTIRDLVGDDKIKIVMDFSRVSYIDSFGIGVLVSSLMTIKKGNGTMRLANINENIRKIFELTKLQKFFDIYGNVDEAIRGS